jgi:hypothetical protein
VVLTQLALQHYDEAIGRLGDDFIWRIAARNVVLLGYLYLVCAPIVRAGAIWSQPVSGRASVPGPSAAPPR